MILTIFVLILTFLFLLFILIYLNQIYKRHIVFKNIPGPLVVPVIGCAHKFATDPSKILPVFMQMISDYGKIVQFWVGPTHLVLTTDVRVAEKVLSSTKHIKKINSLYKYVKPWIGNGLVVNNHAESWHKRRKTLTPAFHFTILEESLRVFSSLIQPFIDQIERHVDGDAFDIFPYEGNYALDVICESAMGVTVHAQTDVSSPYVTAIAKFLELATTRMFTVIGQIDFIYNYFMHGGQEQKKVLNVIHGMAYKVIGEKRRQNENDAGLTKRKHKAFLDILLDCKIDGMPLNDVEIREEVDTFLFAAYETLSKSLGFVLYEIANHPQIQERIFEEINTELGSDTTKPLTTSDLNRLKYLDAVLKETLRMYPPVILLPRQLDEDLKLDDLTIPCNQGVIIFIYGMHRDREYFPDPEVFKPERFLDGERTNRNPFVYIPFSAGPRNCIGQKYALYGLKYVTVKLLQNYELVTAGPEHKIKLTLTAILSSSNGIFVKVKRRAYE